MAFMLFQMPVQQIAYFFPLHCQINNRDIFYCTGLIEIIFHQSLLKTGRLLKLMYQWGGLIIHGYHFERRTIDKPELSHICKIDAVIPPFALLV